MGEENQEMAPHFAFDKAWNDARNTKLSTAERAKAKAAKDSINNELAYMKQTKILQQGLKDKKAEKEKNQKGAERS